VSNQNNNQNDSRREFIKRAAYVAPTVLTLTAFSSFAKAASNKPTTGGGYTPPTFSNAQTQALYTWLISDPARIARLNAAAQELKKLASNVAIAQMTATLLADITSELVAMPGLKATLISQSLSGANLTELAKALLAGA